MVYEGHEGYARFRVFDANVLRLGMYDYIMHIRYEDMTGIIALYCSMGKMINDAVQIWGIYGCSAIVCLLPLIRYRVARSGRRIPDSILHMSPSISVRCLRYGLWVIKLRRDMRLLHLIRHV